MNKHANWIATAVAVTGSFALVGSTQAQGVTGDANLDNMPASGVTAFYPSWTAGGASDSAAGFQMTATGYGSLYQSIPVGEQPTLNTADAYVNLTFTLSAPTGQGSYYVGVPFILDDDTSGTGGSGSSVDYGGYASYGIGTWTESVALSTAQQTAIAAGGDKINGFNLEFDPAPFETTPYTITFDSLTLTPSPVPEPGTMELLGLGAAGALAFWRRKKAAGAV